MKFTMDIAETDLITIDEVIKKLGLEKFCQKQTEGNPLVFEFKDEDGEGTFDVASGDVEYDGGEIYNYYEEELGSYSLQEALDFTTLIWGENEDGETVAYYEA